MERIHIDVSRPYDVWIGRGLIDQIADTVSPALKGGQAAVVTDDIVAGLYLERVRRSLENAGYRVCSFVFPNGERSKNMGTLTDILEYLAGNGIRRSDALIALGGGVTGDMAGLAAALYMRGISVIQIPTTLLAAVDSSVGGKTAIDLKNGKNLAGAFWQPGMVVCDADIIERLPDTVFAEGMAEAIKCSVIRDLPILGWIEEGTVKGRLEEIIRACVELKRDVVRQDEYDCRGIRNILNVGHTAAHAIEKLSGYTVSHGRAVGTGMVMEAGMARELGLCDGGTVAAIESAVRHEGLLTDIPWSPDEIAEAMKSDKKNRDERIVFEFPRAIGRCTEFRLEREKAIDLMKRSDRRRNSNEY